MRAVVETFVQSDMLSFRGTVPLLFCRPAAGMLARLVGYGFQLKLMQGFFTDSRINPQSCKGTFALGRFSGVNMQTD
jgi:hypothetical protein